MLSNLLAMLLLVGHLNGIPQAQINQVENLKHQYEYTMAAYNNELQYVYNLGLSEKETQRRINYIVQDYKQYQASFYKVMYRLTTDIREYKSIK